MISVDVEIVLWRKVIVSSSVVLVAFDMVGVDVELDFY